MGLLIDQYGPGSVQYPWSREREEARAQILHASWCQERGLRIACDDITADARRDWLLRAREGWSS